MRSLIIVSLLLGFLIPTKSALANNDAEKDALAHIGVAYISNDIFYGILHRGLGCTKLESILGSTFATMTLGFTQEWIHSFDLHQKTMDMNDVFNYAKGAALQVGSVLVFNF